MSNFEIDLFLVDKLSPFEESKERIIIGNEDTFKRQMELRRTEVSPELIKKYDGKTREVSYFYLFVDKFFE